MAGPASTTSSMTSTSHTLTHAPSVGFLSSFVDSSKPSSAVEMLELFEAIKSGNRHSFLQPASAIPNASLQLAKATLDAYAGQICDEQQQRQREESKKRKRAENGLGKGEILKIRKLHVDGFESGQVWQQARRIITSALQDSKSALQELEDQKEIQVNGINGDAHIDIDQPAVDVSDDDSADYESASEMDDSEGLIENAEDAEDDEEIDEEDLEDDAELSENDIEGGLEDIDEEEDEIDDEDEPEEASQELVEDPNGLNDGFFSIDDFNKQTQLFEDADARGDPDVDHASDDDEVDWHADPRSIKPSSNGKASKKPTDDVDDEMLSDIEDDEEDGGPTFGNMDLDAPEGESEEEEGDEMDGEDDSNANEIYYKDFFAPPQRKGAKNSKAKQFREPRPTKPDDNDVDRAMADVRRDLFEDESEREDSEDALSDASAGDPKSRKSAHERRQAKLAEEIRQLEAANVAKRQWAMSGEAKAIDRPMNSLLGEDLDFEHVGKPVPVITAEVSESIEDMIKRRILAQEFDEVVKRRPDASEFSSNTRRGLVDLDDTKAKQSLAEMYEEEHVKNTNPDSYVSKADEKLGKEEKEIEQMWKEVSASLDALTSWHYKPKPAAPSLTVVSDVATISMEDAQPTTSQGVSGGDHTLAPQEIYKAGKDTAEKGEVVAKSGLPVAKEEMSREDKVRRRRREKERIRKAGGLEDKKPKSAKAQAQKQTLGDLKLGGVKVINKKGEIVDMEGNKAKAAKAASSSSFKL
ncbi:Mpp10 protein [Daldinia loculata]|uniref:Mpp10 protein n=1 Tax=Daldinia loculata TaxID=103429 RepID=UPI0020C207CC|nr:Mpp10 protein [Daldinia loculata]KAI1646286.1 Mpp10 protein [Daldinia loculata]